MAREKTSDAFERMKARMGKKSVEEFSKKNLYWAGAAGISAIVFGIVDGGVSVAIAYLANMLSEQNND